VNDFKSLKMQIRAMSSVQSALERTRPAGGGVSLAISTETNAGAVTITCFQRGLLSIVAGDLGEARTRQQSLPPVFAVYPLRRTSDDDPCAQVG